MPSCATDNHYGRNATNSATHRNGAESAAPPPGLYMDQSTDEELVFPREDLPPSPVDPNGSEIETEAPPTLDPLASDF